MNLIFLDIDGVLNSDLWYQKQHHQTQTLLDHLDPHCVLQLNKVLRRTEAKVVLSSNWRKHHTTAFITAALQQVGFEGDLLGTTPDLTSKNQDFIRGNEILKWCRENEALLGCRYQSYKTYAIIDDKNDMLYWQRNHFFQTDRYCGLTPSKAAEIIQHFQ